MDNVKIPLNRTIITGEISGLLCVRDRSVYSARERKASPMAA